MKSLMRRVGMAKRFSMAGPSMPQGALVSSMRPSTTGPAPEMQQLEALRPGNSALAWPRKRPKGSASESSSFVR